MTYELKFKGVKMTTGSYKLVSFKGTVSSVEDAYSALQGLRDEIQEIVDGASGTNLENTSRIQTLSEACDNLSDADSMPDIPDVIAECEITYAEQVNKNKRRGASRSVQCNNAVAVLYAAKEAAEEFMSDAEDKMADWPEQITDQQREESEMRADDLANEVQSFIDELDSAIGSFESAEFPGMYG